MRVEDEFVNDIVAMDFPEQVQVFGPMMCLGNLVLLWAWTGIGKSYLALALAFAAATGTKLLHYAPTRKHPVLYADGEMGRPLLKKRFMQLDPGGRDSVLRPAIKVMTLDQYNNKIPNLSDVADQQKYTEKAKDREVIILDNLNTLTRSTGKFDSEPARWERVQDWLLARRSERKLVILVHHAAKSGLQSGTSQKENIMDAVISLRANSVPGNPRSTYFEMHFDKHRDVLGSQAQPLLVEMYSAPDPNSSSGSKIVFSSKPLRLAKMDAARTMRHTSKTKKSVAETLKMSIAEVEQAWDGGYDDAF